MQPEDRIRLEHMLDAAQAALDFIAGRSREDLDRDRLLLAGVIQMLLVIGEAASKVGESVRTDVKGIPWHQVIGARNRLVHAYFDINTDIIWSTTTESLPPLIRELRAILTS